MARVTLNVILVPAAYAAAPVVLPWTAADAALGNQFTGTGKEIVLVYNAGAVTRTATLVSIADPYNRIGDIVYTVAVGGYATFFMVPLIGFQQADGYVYVTGSHADLKFAILRLP